jgi:hypothetical protein
VVDATGRGHRARQWLAAIGFASPEETTIGLDTAYSTANFRRPETYSGEPLVFITGPAPHFTRRGYVITIENGTLLVSLIGRFGDYPPTDREGFLAFASELHSDLAYRIIKDSEQLTPIAHHRFVGSSQRHYERMVQRPKGFLVIGDALCHFNPIYAQGMVWRQCKQKSCVRFYLIMQSNPKGWAESPLPFSVKRPTLTERRGTSPPTSTSHSPRPAAHARQEVKSGHATSPR